ncbi:acetyl-CoA hydrolase/transferase C-terminal domain-containing protein [Marinicella rhabdoformis]|uniref:acetyl-CoA hydrolase/transferase C-terminal domain-containing protein n=1 Tax=Marinicella rhabdoformis TaxID=2580566 RepID=UPI0012AEC2A9|nr:acetyl-CoA hydrolase/transferase C-terminal domain-containing protein [Marinicella rhabdoformis]
MTEKMTTIKDCVDVIIEHVGRELIVGTPLGIGKPNPLVNALWTKAKQEPDLSLEICTALSLQLPKGKSLLERRFLKPVIERIFGDYPELDYIDDVVKNAIPANMKLTEFYMQSGKMLRSATAQRHYISSNYTHAARDILDKGMNVLVQMVAVKQTPNGPVYSLSSNTDLTLDMVKIAKRKNLDNICYVAMVNPNMPFMGGQAEVDARFFDVIVDDKSAYFKPFAAPRGAVNVVDHHIGMMASTLIQDGGTLQVGIGSLGDALVHATCVRHSDPAAYGAVLQQLKIQQRFGDVIAQSGDTKPFVQGLYAASEMFVEGFAHLFQSGILKRHVYPDAEIQALINQSVITEQVPKNIIELLLQYEALDEHITRRQFNRLQALGILKSELTFKAGRIVDSSGQTFATDLFDYDHIQAIQAHCLGDKLKQGVVLHAAFFLGSPWFYQWLHDLDDETRTQFQMTPVGQVNELYGGEALDRVQRVKARFINTCMKVDVMGAAASDTLDNNQVVSGVGGQYNFVAMAHALEDSRSILMLKSTHMGDNGLESNVVWKYPYCTIPRHLRDIVITEYGIADLRGLSDEDCIKQMISVADSAFQEDLRAEAVKYNKLSADWVIPEAHRNNTLASLKNNHNKLKTMGQFPEYPFGSDFTDLELDIIQALQYLKSQSSTWHSKLKLVYKAWCHKPSATCDAALQRMGLDQPQNREEKLSAMLLAYAFGLLSK